MMLYTVLDEEKVPEILKNKPKWVSCVTFLMALLMLVLLAVSIGIIIGYTYCYIEHRTGLRPGHLLKESNFHVVQALPQQDFNETRPNRTINGAIMSSLLVSRILTIGHALMEEELSRLPGLNKEPIPMARDTAVQYHQSPKVS